MKATLGQVTQQKVTVTNVGDVLQPTTPITLKNQLAEIVSIESIQDVEAVDVTSGSTLVYNSENDKYEIRKIAVSDLSISIDGGAF